jgi:hypothetical protein
MILVSLPPTQLREAVLHTTALPLGAGTAVIIRSLSMRYRNRGVLNESTF